MPGDLLLARPHAAAPAPHRARERTRVPDPWTTSDAPAPPDRGVHQLFVAQAARTPGAAALICDDDGSVVTYAELHARAQALARRLRAVGVAPGHYVALVLERSAGLVVAELAVLLCGAAYVPLDPHAPSERLGLLLGDCGARVGLVDRASGGTRPPDAAIVWLDVSAVPAADGAAPDDAPAGVEVSGAAPAYVMYTSGSTGKPKGVVVAHRGIARLVLHNGYVDVGVHDRVAFVAHPAFDASTFELWLALLTGGAAVVIPRATVLDPARFGAALVRHGVTVLLLTVGLFNAYADHLAEAFGGLRYLLVGGDALDARVVARVLERPSRPAALLNAYGPTEATTIALTHRVTHVPAGARSIPLGRPIGNTSVHVLDADGEPVPVGTPGELYIGGAGVALGYLGRPGLTAERFGPDPFSGEPGARLYRTGDRVLWRDDGTVEFLGRVDDQVKLRGFRIEPGEIAVYVNAYPAVRDAVVVARADAAGNTRLVAYVVVDAGAFDAAALRSHLRSALPEYMVPSVLVRLDALPLTPSGKVDRRALPAPDEVPATAASDAPAADDAAPIGEVEAAIAAAWVELLGVSRVGRHDNFFALGGHSLLAVTLVERLRRRGIALDVRALFATPTPAALAAAAAPAAAIVVPPSAIPAGADAITPEMLPLVALTREEIDRLTAQLPLGAANVQDVYPLTPLQEGILFHHLLAADGEGDPYLLARLLGFDTRARLDAYVDALAAVGRRHDVLRTAVCWEGLPEPVQVVWRRAPIAVDEVALDPADGDVAEQLYARFDPRRVRLDVRRAPLLRLAAAHDAAHGRWLLLIRLHHLAGDHTALDVLHEEVAAHLLGRADALPAAAPLRTFVAQARLGVRRAEHEAFFRAMLGDVVAPTVPFGAPRGDGAVREATQPVNADLARRLRAGARALGVSAASICHVAWARVLSRACGRGDVVFGTVLFGRLHGGEGIDRTMGLLMNTLPVRLRVGGAGAATAVRQAQDVLAGLLRHEHAPLALAQRCSSVRASAPLFSTLLNYRYDADANASAETLADARAAAAGITVLRDVERSTYPVALSIDDLGAGFALAAQSAAEVDPESLCALMHDALAELVDALEGAPDAPWCDPDAFAPPPAAASDAPTADDAAPVGEVETAIAAAWVELLGIPRVGRHDNFFALGGHSLLAITLVERLRQRGIALDVRAIFATPTPAALAAAATPAGRTVATPAAIASDARPALPDGRVVVIRAAGTEPPFFLVHEGDGDPADARALAEHIDAAVPIYALSVVAPGEAPLRTVEGHAARLRRLIQAIQPHGPYRLAGWSSGGVLAYAIAGQLVGCDEEVAFVGVLDARLRGAGARPPELACAEHLPLPLTIPVHVVTVDGDEPDDALRRWRAQLPGAQLVETCLSDVRSTDAKGATADGQRLDVVGEVISRGLRRDGAARRPCPAGDHAPLVRLQGGRRGATSLYCIPGAGANATSFTELAGCLDPTWSIHGLQPRGLTGDQVPHASVASAASAYLRALQHEQPDGPVHLLGHSFGGWVAFEMAVRLRAAGRPVAAVTIVDTEGPDERPDEVHEYDAAEAFQMLVEVCEQMAECSLGLTPGDMASLDGAARLARLRERLVHHDLMPERAAADVLRGPYHTMAASIRAGYRPSGTYAGPVRLVLASESGGDPEAGYALRERIAAGWRRWAPDVSCSAVPGNHMTALRSPHVQAVAALLRPAAPM